jgi:hypothetical protein
VLELIPLKKWTFPLPTQPYYRKTFHSKKGTSINKASRAANSKNWQSLVHQLKMSLRLTAGTRKLSARSR